MQNKRRNSKEGDGDKSHRSNQSAVARKFEELRQSIQLNNSINERRNSVSHQPQVNNQDNYEHEDGNRQVHTNPDVLAIEMQKVEHVTSTPDNQQVKQVVTHKNKSMKKGDKEKQAKEELTLKVDHKIPLNELSKKLNVDFERGIDQTTADRLLIENGENKLSEKEKTSLWVKLFKELTNGFALMLWGGGVLCFITYGLTPDDPSNLYLGIVILVVISITSGITFFQNAKSEALMDTFKNFLPQNCTTLRGGEIKIINALKLVVGDVVLIKAGEKLPADIRILESNEMKVDNSPLTGESEALLRTVECTHPDNYLETSNLAFFGTLCKEGTGKGVVISTGDRTTLGQIADLSSGEKKNKTPLRIELDRFVVMITIIALSLGVLFFLLAYFLMAYPYLTCIIFGIGILVANVPEGLLGCITISLAITAKTLAKKQVLVKNLEAVETLGSTSCICSDKTGTLTQNVMSVKHMWYKDSAVLIKNKALLAQGEAPEYNVNDLDFKMLHQSAMICSEARFDTSNEKDLKNIDYLTCPVIGDATETGLIRFYQYVEDVNSFREKFQIVRNPDKTYAKMPFNSQVKFALTIVEEKTDNSNYCVYIKGAPEKIWSYCSSIMMECQPQNINSTWNDKFKSVNLKFGKGGERVLGFARLPLPAKEYPIGTHFVVSSVSKFNFKLTNFQFCGLVSLMDPPKTRVPGAILECRSAGIKVIMVTGDQPPTAAAIAKEVNIIPLSTETNEDILEKNPNMSWFEASERCEAIVVHGDRIVESIEKCIEEQRGDQYYYLRQWVKKPYCVFARTTPAQKLQIVQACQSEQYICAVTGDGVNDSPAIKQADIGISMNISGSDVTKDAADMILLDDDFASIVSGVEEGRKIFDNLKKTVVYLLTSNMTEIIPFLAFIAVQLPLPLSSIFMLVICVGTDIWPALSLAYEEAELDIMTRRPRRKDEHLVSRKLITTAYLQMGEIACAAGFIGFFVTFNYFGFPVKNLFGMAVATGYKVPPSDFKSHLSPMDLNGIPDPYQNSLLNAVAPDCRLNVEESDKLKEDIDWFLVGYGKNDLRKSFLDCDSATGKWVPQFEWSHCDVGSDQTYSVITGETACYTTDAIKWAQSVYFVCIVFVQWSNIFACKSRKMSFTTSQFNSVMIHGIIFETILSVFLLYVPGVQDVFGGRPLEFWQFGVPGFVISVTLLCWDETRKYLTRTNRWFLKYCLW